MDLSLFLPPLVACLVIVAIHSYLGLHVIAREVIFVDLSLAQMAALGSAVAILAGRQPDSPAAFLYALGFTSIGAVVFALTRTEEKGLVPQEAIIGIVYVVASAAAILVADRTPRGGEAIKDILVGSLLWVTWPVIARLAGVYAVIGLLHWVLQAPVPDHLLPARDRAGERLANPVVGFPVLPVVRHRDHVLGPDRRRAAGVLLPGCARGHRLSVHPPLRPVGARLLARGRAGLGRQGCWCRSTTTCRPARSWCACSGCSCWLPLRCGDSPVSGCLPSSRG